MRARRLLIGFGVAQVASLVVCALTLLSVRELLTDLRDARRAWLVVPNVAYAQPGRLMAGNSFILGIPYSNVGRAPAFDVGIAIEDGYVAVGKPALTYATIDLPPKDMCAAPMTPTDPFVFPNPDQSIDSDKPRKPSKFFDSVNEDEKRNLKISENFLKGKALYYVRGCLSYRTLGRAAKTAFCYFGPFMDEEMTTDKAFLILPCQSGNDAL